ncbi:hypothetical protein Acsp05_39310 [Actinokineospora sp. NBRC 105648]|nr:hypothetical protein Acsp05_39310 [Actinokineospora sp. NBRC 105648]
MSGKSRYPELFRRDAVALVRSSDRPLRRVARELGVNHETLRNWVRTDEQDRAAAPAGGVSADERQELRELRKRVAELGLEKEILRKAAACFAKGSVVDPQLPVHLRTPPSSASPGCAGSWACGVRASTSGWPGRSGPRTTRGWPPRSARSTRVTGARMGVRGSSSRCAAAAGG